MRDFEERRARFGREFERQHRVVNRMMVLAWIVSFAFVAVIVWAIIRVVQHFT